MMGLYIMRLEDILSEWTKDSKIDNTELDKESLKIPALHNKYLKMYTSENLKLKRMLHEYKNLERDKFEYYAGKMCQEDLDERGWDQFDHKLLKQDIPRYLGSDRELITVLLKIDYQREKVETVKSIMSSINGRSFNISNAIKWQQFLNGIN